MFFKESIIAKLWWFFKLEKRRYIVGILALSLVSVLNLIPPMVMGRVIDAITSGKLTNQILLLNLVYLLLAALADVYLGDLLSLGSDYEVTPFWAFYQDVAFFLPKVPNW